jgi:hypothetical protein
MAKALPRVDGHGPIDMHVHIGPELLMRRYSPASLAEEARREGIGVVMKNHFQPTTGWVSQLRRPDDPVPLIGSVALNYGAGGIDDHGVRAALSGWKRDVLQPDPDPERFVVWMPTVCAEGHLAVTGRRDIMLEWGITEANSRVFAPGEGIRLNDAAGRPVAGLARALAIVARHDLVLASGHLDHDETILLVRLAREAGVRRIVLTHPLFPSTELEPATVARLWRDYGAYTELCFVNLAMDNLSIKQYVELIEAVGPEGCILSSDVGQPFSPPVGEALRAFFAELQKGGVSEDDVARMAVLNPRRLLFGEFPR